MNDFKEQLYQLLINEQAEEIMYENFKLIYNWPELSYYDEEADSTSYEYLNTDNCSIIDICDEYLEAIAGGDIQKPHLVRVELLSGELTVTTYEPHEFLSGMDYDEIVEELSL